ncbi:hypothetical protein [Terrimonas alba]|uniref:hypothetical protein n=1 Tax=Terrimonas alba TaxID=3349636 RepID=UPI0035F33A80
MSKISFSSFLKLCELNSGEKYVEEVLYTIRNSECLFHPGIIMPNEHIASLYKFRLENAKESNRLSKDALNDYENTVSALLSTKSTDLALATLYSDEYGFVVFYEPLSKKILGVLKSKNNSTLHAMEEHNTDTINQGLSSGFQKYSKGEFVKDWR